MLFAIVLAGIAIDGQDSVIAGIDLQGTELGSDGVVVSLGAFVQSVSKAVFDLTGIDNGSVVTVGSALPFHKAVSGDFGGGQRLTVIFLGGVAGSQLDSLLLNSQHTGNGFAEGVVLGNVGLAALDHITGDLVGGGAGIGLAAFHNCGQHVTGNQNIFGVGITVIGQSSAIVYFLVAVSSNDDLSSNGGNGQSAVNNLDLIVIQIGAFLGSILKGVIDGANIQDGRVIGIGNALFLHEALSLNGGAGQRLAIIGLGLGGRSQRDLLLGDHCGGSCGNRVVVIVGCFHGHFIAAGILELRHGGEGLAVVLIGNGPIGIVQNFLLAVLQNDAGQCIVEVAIISTSVSLDLNGSGFILDNGQRAGLILDVIVLSNIDFAVLDNSSTGGVGRRTNGGLAAGNGDRSDSVAFCQPTGGDFVTGVGQRRTIIGLGGRISSDGNLTLIDHQLTVFEGNGKLIGDIIAIYILNDRSCIGKAAGIGTNIGAGGDIFDISQLVAFGQTSHGIGGDGLLSTIIGLGLGITDNLNIGQLAVLSGVGHILSDGFGNLLVPTGEIVTCIGSHRGLFRSDSVHLDIFMHHITIFIVISCQSTVGTLIISNGESGLQTGNCRNGELNNGIILPFCTGDGQEGFTIGGIILTFNKVHISSIQRDGISQGISVVGGIAFGSCFSRTGQRPLETVFAFQFNNTISNIIADDAGHGVGND